MMTDFTEETAVGVLEDADLANLPRSDLGNARRLISRFGENLRFVPSLGWRCWVGTHWAVDQEGEAAAARAAHDTADAMCGEVAALIEAGAYDGEEPKEFEKRIAAARRWAMESGNAGRTRAMLSQAEAYLRRDHELWDADPLTFNVANGTLKFEKVDGGVKTTLHPHTREDYCTARAPVFYDPAATAPLWEAHMRRSVPSAEKRSFFQRYCGSALTGVVGDQKFLIMQGPGADGKSTTIHALAHMMGDYAMQANIKSFLQNENRSGGDASPDIARLAGPVRFLYVSEPPKGAKLDESTIKGLTGGDRITARKLRQDIFEFYPSFKMVVPCNPLPKITSNDWGTWRRIMLMKWEHRVPEHMMDVMLGRKLEAEKSGILNWAIEGLSDWLHERINMPASIKIDVAKYRGDSDPMSVWLAERYDVAPSIGSIKLSDLHKDYKAWCEDNSKYAMSSSALGFQLDNANIGGHRTGGTSYRTGLRLKAGLEMRVPGMAASREDDGDPTDLGGDERPQPPAAAYGGGDE